MLAPLFITLCLLLARLHNQIYYFHRYRISAILGRAGNINQLSVVG